MWWFETPASPWVSANIAVDITTARAYLASLPLDEEGNRPTLQHLLCGAVGRTLTAWPMANARIVGRRIVPQDRVGVAMPVNLLGHAEGERRELGMVVVEDAGRASLRDLARRTRRTVRNERSGETDNAFFRAMIRLAEGAPDAAMRRTLDGLDRARRLGGVDTRLHALMPVTTGLTNPGAAFREAPGVLFRGGAISLPDRLVHVGTLWGVSAAQDEVIPVDGVPAVRPMLPILLVFDHRLVDGILASRVLLHLARILKDPAATFGADGQRSAGA